MIMPGPVTLEEKLENLGTRKLLRRILRCIYDYAENNKKYPSQIIIPDNLYERFQKDYIITEYEFRKNPGIISVMQSKVTGTLRAFKYENLPEEYQKTFGSWAKKMEIPIILCQKGWILNIKKPAAYNIGASLWALAQI